MVTSERKKEYNKKYWIKNREEINKRNHEYHVKHREEINLQAKKYYQNNKEKIKKYIQTYQKTEKFKIKHRASNKKRYFLYRKEMFDAIGSKVCKMCGFTDERALAINHINNDGFLERRIFRAISQKRQIVLKEPHRYQVLCFNCNQIKKYEAANVSEKS